jgi:DNA-binding NarL/FixJ family response regulator
VNKPIDIIVTETSTLIFEGLSAIINNSGIPSRIIRAITIDETVKYMFTNMPYTIICSPSLIQNRQKQFSEIKNEYPNSKWIALIYNWFDPDLTSQFDAAINLTDSPEKIISIINQVSTSGANYDAGVKGDILSDREIDVLKLLAAGLSNKEIGDKLSISANTVITHRKNITQKTGIKSAQGLTIYAVVKKLIRLENLH